MADAITEFVDPACGDDRDLDQTARRDPVIAPFVRNLFNGQIRYAHDFFLVLSGSNLLYYCQPSKGFGQ